MHRHTQPRPAPLLRTLVLAVVCLTRELLAHHVGGERQRLAAGVRVDLQLREAITAAAVRLNNQHTEEERDEPAAYHCECAVHLPCATVDGRLVS